MGKFALFSPTSFCRLRGAGHCRTVEKTNPTQIFEDSQIAQKEFQAKNKAHSHA